tara:strand:- start:38 stop:463 length:426 start_codon:yes stop_codon:yes gene_type:complete
MIKKENIIFGEEQEHIIRPILESYFDRKLYLTDKYSIFDFHCGKKYIYLELKSMRHTANKFNSTMIGYNKVLEALRKKKQGCRCFFVFNFLDSIKYIEVTEKILDTTDWVKNFNNKKYLYIPVKYLENLNEGDSIFIPDLD